MYGLKYKCEFDAISDEAVIFKVEIFQKSYTGQMFDIKGSTTPVLQQWETDDPKAPIKGCSLNMAFINDGTLPLSSFFSTDDDDFKVVFSASNSFILNDSANMNVVPGIRGQTNITINKSLSDTVVSQASYIIINGIKYNIVTISKDSFNTYITTFGTPIIHAVTDFTIGYGAKQVLFQGFIVQDDCSEVLLDFTHEINISANDNLGLLKDVSLDKANIFSLYYTSGSEPIAADFNTRTFLSGTIRDKVDIGDRIQLSGTTIDGVYTVNKLVYDVNGISVLIYVDEPLPANYAGYTVYQIFKPANLLDKTPLSTLLRMCLSVTGLQLETDVYGKIIEVSQDPSRSFLEQTLIDPQTFLKSDTEYTDCYDVLEKILARFNMTLFQSNGVWNIIRWDELRYYNNLMDGFKYDSDFNYIGTITKTAPLQSGINQPIKAETGILQKINRPLLYDKETFNYQYPRQLLRNFNLKQLGSLIKTYTTGSGDNLQNISEYNATWWDKAGMVSTFEPGNYFIRVTSDSFGNEIERVLVVNGYCRCFQIEANAGDSFKFSFSFRTQDSQSGTVSIVFFAEINDGINKSRFMNPDLTLGNKWQTNGGFVYQILSGDNSNTWHTVEMDSSHFPIPFDGLLYFYLVVGDLKSPIRETYYKDIRFEYTARINDTTKIIGQTHQSSQAGTIKNTSEEEIFIDSSPRNSIAGTLFLNSKVGLLQKRTSKWEHPYLTQSKNLGDLTTYEQMFWRRKPRTIMEGTLYGIIQSGSYISLLSVLKYDYFPTLNLVFGKLEIDYKNNKLDCTLWEMWEDGETDSNAALQYKFDYLYSTE